jgi:maltose/moltooligosaccharide transporter
MQPRLTFWQIWNMCFGFLGIQIGFALQNANMSRIFETLGSSIDAIAILWVAAPLTGLLVQPVVGYFSDRTWSGLGRRRPYFLAGALLSTVALLAMPSVTALWQAAGLLWLLDASLNVTMEPFRALVADQLAEPQRADGYAMQSFFIGVGAVAASALPWVFEQAGVSNVAAPGHNPDTLRWSFYVGAAALLLAVLWSVIRTREAPLVVSDTNPSASDTRRAPPAGRQGLALIVAGALAMTAIVHWQLDQALYVLAGGLLALGGLRALQSRLPAGAMLTTLLIDVQDMPATMRRLIPVQFFTWLALFAMWIYTTPAVTQWHFGAAAPGSAAYNSGANWVGVLFAVYNGCAALAAMVVPFMTSRLGVARAHALNLALGALGLASFWLIHNPYLLVISMIGVGFAWCSIVSLPYAMLAGSVPPERMGTYMGIFNFSIVVPQIVAASVLGLVVRSVFGGQPIYALVFGAGSLLVAAWLALRADQPA